MDEITKNIYEALSGILDLPKNATYLKLEMSINEAPTLTITTVLGDGELRDHFDQSIYQVLENKKYKLKKII